MVATLSEEISRLFADMSLVSALTVAVGFMLLVVEFFQPTRSVASAAGVVSALAGITARMLTDGTEGTLFLLLIGFAAAVYGAHVVMLAAFKRDWLMQSAYLKVSHVEIDRPLTGLTGRAITDFDGYGRVEADGLELFAVSDGAIRKGDAIRIERVCGDKIYVVAA